MAERSIQGFRGPDGESLSPLEGEEYFNLLKTHDFPQSRGEFFQKLLDSPTEEWISDGVKAGLDLAMAANEFVQYLQSDVRHGRGVQRGDGSTLVIAEGFGAAEIHYIFPAVTFRRIGYNAKILPLRKGLNLEPMENMVEQVMNVVKEEAEMSGKKVKYIGHSKGGLLGAITYATHQDEFEKYVDHLMLVGSPNPQRVNNLVGLAYLGTLLVAHRDDFKFTSEIEKIIGLAHKPELMMTQIRATYDPIISGTTIGSKKDVISINGSHSGLLYNPLALQAISMRLAMNIRDQKSVVMAA